MKSGLLEALRKIEAENLISFHMPGHKNNKGYFKEKLKGLDLIDLDLTEIPGVDYLHDAQSCIANSQSQLSEFYQSYKSYFLVNGSTCGILAMVFATTKRNDKILVNRNAHQSILNAIVLNGLEPIYIMPKIDDTTGMILGITKEDLREKLSQNPQIKTVILTYPSYEGICFDIEEISKVAKEYKCYLIIDEAHGSHLLSHEKLPKSACTSSADVVVQSAHKNLPAFTQGAFLHLFNEGLRENIEKYLKIFQSTSPSYLIMASLDMTLEFLKKESYNQMDILLGTINNFVARLKKTNYQVVNWGITNNRTSYSFDPTKIIISSLAIGLDGHTLEKLLRNAYQIQVEYATDNFVVLIASALNMREDFEKLLKALVSIEKNYKKEAIGAKKPLILENVKVRIKPEAVEEFSYQVKAIDEALGKIAYESIIPYPPGIPLINPGEEITSEAVDQLKVMTDNIKIIEE